MYNSSTYYTSVLLLLLLYIVDILQIKSKIQM